MKSRVVEVENDGYHSEEDIIEQWQMAIPQSLQPRVVQLLHEGHQGEVKTKALLRSKVWFPGVDSMVNAAVKSCHALRADLVSHPATQSSQMTLIVLENHLIST